MRIWHRRMMKVKIPAASLEDEEAGEPLSPGARIFHEPGFDSYIITMMGMGQKMDVDAFKAGLESSFVLHPRFSSIPVMDESGTKTLRWIRTKVVVEDHLVVPDLDTKSTTPDLVVEDYLSSLSATTLDPSRPLWDFHILNIRTADAESTALFRLHHSLGDGISLISLFFACTRKTSDPNSLPSMPVARRPPPVKHHCLWSFLLWLWALFVLSFHTLVDMLLFTATAAFSKDSDTPLKGKKGVEFRRKRIVHRTVSLDDVKAIKNEMGGTVNDVLVGITSAGLSRYLGRSFGEGNGGKKDFFANIRVRTTLVVNIRQTPGNHTLAEMIKGEGRRWGNCLGYTVMPIPIFKCKDPLDYIRRGNAIAQRKKKSFEAILSNQSAFWIMKLFGMKAATTLCHRVLSHTTLSFSNLIGPVDEVGLYGHPMVYIAPSAYGHPQALALHFMSYMNKLTIVATVDEQTIPDPHKLLDDLAVSIKIIKNAIQGFSY